MIAIHSMGNFCSCRKYVQLKMARLHIKANYAVYRNRQALSFLNKEIKTEKGRREYKNSACIKRNDLGSIFLELVHFKRKQKLFFSCWKRFQLAYSSSLTPDLSVTLGGVYSISRSTYQTGNTDTLP